MTAPADRHVDDGVLLALHDGERSPELDRDRGHVEHCGDCQARMAAVRNDARVVREALSSIEVAPLDAGVFRRRLASRRVPLWRRSVVQAAAAVIVIAVIAAASPVRAWLQSRMTQSAPVEQASSSKRPPAGAPDLGGATVTFAATGPTFVIEIDSAPGGGMLVLERTTATEISARISSGAGTGGDEMVVLPAALRLRNSAASRASYVFSVPNTVARVRVVIAGRTAFDGPPPAELRLAR